MTPAMPQTRSSLARDLRGSGLRAGDAVLLHASLRALGWVCGGAPTVVRALLDVLGDDGTLVVPAQTPENRDPSRWQQEPVPELWWPIIRAELPPFEPAISPCRSSGLIAETVRTWPGSVRSAHPQTSFAAVGRLAPDLMRRHELTSELGEHSPLAALDAVDGRAMLLGVGYDRCTAFHLAEYRMPGLRREPKSCVVMTSSGRRWITYPGVALDAGPFTRLGAAFEASSGSVAVHPVGATSARLFRIRAAVEFAVDWLRSYRSADHAGQ